MRNYKYLFILLLVNIVVKAQPPKEKIEQYRIAFITKELDLTVEEAKVFWPVYNKYRDELELLRTNNRIDLESIDYTKLTDEDADKKAKEILSMKQAELDVQKKYYAEFKKVISAKKVLMLIKADADFKKKLLEILQQRKQGQR